MLYYNLSYRGYSPKWHLGVKKVTLLPSAGAGDTINTITHDDRRGTLHARRRMARQLPRRVGHHQLSASGITYGHTDVKRDRTQQTRAHDSIFITNTAIFRPP